MPQFWHSQGVKAHERQNVALKEAMAMLADKRCPASFAEYG
jgi:hypothetical protein